MNAYYRLMPSNYAASESESVPRASCVYVEYFVNAASANHW